MNEQRVVATAGHVDHGKSTLVRALTGTDPDRLEEEQRRGLTIELGFAWCDLPSPGSSDAAPAADPGTPAADPGTPAADPGADGAEAGTGLTVAFVDVPGHERFIETMLAGTGPAPAAMLVVAADDGWSAQTEEHVEVLDLLAVPGLAVAITKVDLVDADRLAEVRRDVARRLAGTSLEGAPLVDVDGPRGRGVTEVATALGRGLARRPPPVADAPPRLWVDRAFPVRGAGTVVTGTLGGGPLRVGDELQVLPAGHPVRVRGLQSLGAAIERAEPGTRVAVNLAGIDRDEVTRGDALVGGGPWRTTTVVDAVVRALPGRTVDRPGAWRVHVGSAAVTARVLPLTDPIASPPGWSTDAATGAVRLLLNAPLPVVAGDRLVLREGGRRLTVGGGQVADPHPGPPPRGRAARQHRADGLRAVATASDAAARLRALLALDGGARPGAVALASAGLAGTGPRPEGVVALGDHAVLTSVLEGWAEASLAALVRGDAPGGAVTGADVEMSRSAGVARGVLVDAAVAVGAPRPLADLLPDHLVATGRLARTPGGFTSPQAADRASDAIGARDARFLAAFGAEPFSPPDVTATAREHGLDHRDVNRLVQSGALVRTGDLTFTAAAVERAVATLERLEAEVGPFTAAQAKNAWGTTRRSAIPLLEHLDRTRVTTFDGRLRTLTRRHRRGS